MHLRWKLYIGLFALACVIATAVTTLRVRDVTDLAQNQDRLLPIKVKELRQQDGSLPVRIHCDPARVSGSSTLDGFTCRFINIAPKKILAASVFYSVYFEIDGKTSVDKRIHTLETVIHPDFFEEGKSILSGGERTIQPPGPISYGEAVITGLEIEIDHIEYEDRTTLGPNVKGGQVIADIREGAARYKAWLVKEFKERDGAVASIAPLLRKDQPLPVVLEGTTFDQGARAYRSRLLRVYETGGPAQVARYLNR